MRPEVGMQLQIRRRIEKVVRQPDRADNDRDKRSQIRRLPLPWAAVPIQPNMSAGANTMLMITVAVCTTMPGLKFPVPRSAAAITTMGN